MNVESEEKKLKAPPRPRRVGGGVGAKAQLLHEVTEDQYIRSY